MDYRDIIRGEFQKRRNGNPFYSLRSFAKDIDLTVQHLSRIFKGQKGLSKIKAYEVGRNMGLTHKEIRLFQALVSSQSGRGPIERGFGRMYLRKESSSPAASELEMRAVHSFVPLRPIVKKRRSRSW